jgi:iron-sulfur cluster assembly protein
MMQPDITVLPAAEKFMRRMVRCSGHPAGGFRLRVSRGGCSGYSSEFTVEPAPLEGDAELAINGLRLFLPGESRLLLEGVTVDFGDTSLQTGLTFINPNADVRGCATTGESKPPVHATVPLASIRRR